MPILIRGTLLFALLATGVDSSVQAQAVQGQAAQGEVGAASKPRLSAQDKISQGEAILRRARSLAERLSKMLDGARREKDIMRANCLNRKLTEVNASTRSVEQRLKALRDAANGNDEGRVGHEFTVASVLGQKIDQLDQEASQCLGQDVYEAGASQVVTTIPDSAKGATNPASATALPPAPPSVTVPPPMSPAK